jgi:hypothetical protein
MSAQKSDRERKRLVLPVESGRGQATDADLIRLLSSAAREGRVVYVRPIRGRPDHFVVRLRDGQ